MSDMIDDLVNRAVLDDLLLLLKEYPKREAQQPGVAVAPRPPIVQEQPKSKAQPTKKKALPKPLLPPIVEEHPALQPPAFADGPDEVAALQQAYQDEIARFLDAATDQT